MVLTYRGSGIINLATRRLRDARRLRLLGADPAICFTLSRRRRCSLSLVVVLAAGAAIELGVFRPLRTTSPLAKLVASLGVLLALQASMLLAFSTLPQPEPQVLPQNTVSMLGGGDPDRPLHPHRDRDRR